VHLSAAILAEKISHALILLGILQSDQLVEYPNHIVAHARHRGNGNGVQKIITPDVADKTRFTAQTFHHIV